MATFKFSLKASNSAFVCPDYEIAKILRGLAKEVSDTPLQLLKEHDFVLVDTNGNTVGKAIWKASRSR